MHMAEIDNGKEEFCFTCPLEAICVDNGKAPPCAELVVEKITAPNMPSAKCYSVECPAIWFDRCTSLKWRDCSVRESE